MKRQLRNTLTQYGLLGASLHWVIAAIIIFLLILGLYMTRIPISLEKLRLFGMHKEWGILVLFLCLLRIVWRLMNMLPELPLHVPHWQRLTAEFAHLLLYFCMFLLPITGWLLTSAAGLPVSFFGLFLLPNLIAPNTEIMHLLVNLHSIISYALIFLLALHIGAALKHHFVDKDDVLRRIL